MISVASDSLGLLYIFLYVQLVMVLLFIILFQFLHIRFLSRRNRILQCSFTDLKTAQLCDVRDQKNTIEAGIDDYLRYLTLEIEKISKTLYIKNPDMIDLSSIDENSLELPLLMRYLFLSAEKEALIDSVSKAEYLKNIQLSFYRLFKIIESILLKDLIQNEQSKSNTDCYETKNLSIHALEDKTKYYEERIEALEKFRTLFFELQVDYDGLEEKYKNMLAMEQANNANSEDALALQKQAQEELKSFDFSQMKKAYEERLEHSLQEINEIKKTHQTLLIQHTSEKKGLTKTVSSLKGDVKLLEDELKRSLVTIENLEPFKTKCHKTMISLNTIKEENMRLQNELIESDRKNVILENQNAHVEQLRNIAKKHAEDAKKMMSSVLQLGDEKKELFEKYEAIYEKYETLKKKQQKTHLSESNNKQDQKRILSLETELNNMKKHREEATKIKAALISLEYENTELKKRIAFLETKKPNSSPSNKIIKEYKEIITEKDKELSQLRNKVKQLEGQFLSFVHRKS